jgi:Putative DNA-binding domain
MIPRKLEDITLEDIEGLIAAEVREGRTIDYKQGLPGNLDSDKKEFLADATSFSNTIGGDLVFGLSEFAGVPTEVQGIDVDDMDAEMQRLDSILSSGVEPRIRYRTQVLANADGRHVLVMRIDKSGIAPHRVTYKSHDKFYARNSAGKYPLDVNELRDAFLRNATASERIREFLVDRLASIAAGESPMQTEGKPLLVLHFLPLEAFSSSVEYDISEFYRTMVCPVGTSSSYNRINIDGVLHYSYPRIRDSGSSNYVQIYRNGILEVTDEFAFHNTQDRNWVIPLTDVEKRILEHVPQYIRCMQTLGVSPPVYLFLSFLGAKNCIASTNFLIGLDDHPTLGRDPLVLPEATFLDLSDDVGEVLKPTFNSLWNAFGFEGSPSREGT